MKPPPFDYSRPTTVAEAVGLLTELGHDAKVLAGGQSLVPLLSMRLAAPAHIVDINAIGELDYLRVTDDGVRVGALCRHAALEQDEAAAAAQPLLRQALRLVAHPTIRNRGTTVGSIVHADPSGEMTAVLALLGGSVRVAGAAGTRTISADEFFLGALESDVRAGELAVEVLFPNLDPRSGTAFVEIARRHGDYAMCGAGAIVELDSDLRVRSARLALLSVSPTPCVVDLTDELGGRTPEQLQADAGLAESLAAGVRDRIEPDPDIHASAEYRRHLAGVLTVDALRRATVTATAQEGLE